MIIRKGQKNDLRSLYDLYKKVARSGNGIARTENEITETYFYNLFRSVQDDGLMLVGKNEENGALITEIHAVKYGIKIFEHILTGVTIAVDPDFQSSGYGEAIFKAFLNAVKTNRPDIKRIELESRTSNQKAQSLFNKLGFQQEAVMKEKTRNPDGTFEDSILMAWENPAFAN